MAALYKEGLIETSPSGGYIMRRITSQEIDDAIAVRGNLEGLCARLLAERGLARQQSIELRACLDESSKIIEKPTIQMEDHIAWTDMNDRFHRVLCNSTGNRALIRAIGVVSQLPFAAASALVPGVASPDQGKKWLIVADFQHRCLVEAIEKGNGVRAQALAEEHVNIARQNLSHILERAEAMSEEFPAVRLLASV